MQTLPEVAHPLVKAQPAEPSSPAAKETTDKQQEQCIAIGHQSPAEQVQQEGSEKLGAGEQPALLENR